MSKHDLEEMGTTGYFLAEDSQFRLRKLQDYMMFLSQLAQPRSSEEEHPWGPGPDIRTADLEICLELLAEQVQIVLDEVSWPAERVPPRTRPPQGKHADPGPDKDRATAAEADEAAVGSAGPSGATPAAASAEDGSAAPDELRDGPDAVAEPPGATAATGDDEEPTPLLGREVRFVVTMDQIDALHRLVDRLAAHADLVIAAAGAELATGTLVQLGEALWDGAEAVRGIVQQLDDHPLDEAVPPRSGVAEEPASYGAVAVVARRTTWRDARRVGPRAAPVVNSQALCMREPRVGVGETRAVYDIGFGRPKEDTLPEPARLPAARQPPDRTGPPRSLRLH